MPCRSTVAMSADRLPRRRALADEYPHALPALFLRLLEFGALVVGFHARGQVGIELSPQNPRGVPVDATLTRRCYLGQHRGVATYDPRVVHYLSDANRSVHIEELGQLGEPEFRARTLEDGRGHAARSAYSEGEGEAAGCFGQRDNARDAEHVRYLVRVRGHRCRPVRQHRADELVDPSLVDSTCICGSTKAAVREAPSTSTTSRASRGPHPAMTPSATARSLLTHSRVPGTKTLPPLIRRSAGSSPRATASILGVPRLGGIGRWGHGVRHALSLKPGARIVRPKEGCRRSSAGGARRQRRLARRGRRPPSRIQSAAVQ